MIRDFSALNSQLRVMADPVYLDKVQKWQDYWWDIGPKFFLRSRWGTVVAWLLNEPNKGA